MTAAWASALAVALLLVVTAPARAQVAGVVLGPGDIPVEGATVEAWSDSERLATRFTSATGRFSFQAGLRAPVTRIYVQRLGLKTLSQKVDERDQNITIRMEQEAIPIEGLVVQAELPTCSRQEDDEARRLWGHLVERYSSGIDTLGVATYLASSVDMVSVGEIGPVELTEPAREQRGSAPLLRFSWRRWIERNGYARSIRRRGPEGAYDSWVYPPLEADLAPHFLDEVFGELHRFTFIDTGEKPGWTLAFCPRDDDDPFLRGSLKVSPDTTLIVAEWSFHTPEPHEDAGGRAVFTATPGQRDRAYLLPLEGLFWREQGSHRYEQEYHRYEGWIVSPGDSVPFLPNRNEAKRSGQRQTGRDSGDGAQGLALIGMPQSVPVTTEVAPVFSSY